MGIDIEVVYALCQQQTVITLNVAANTCVRDAIEQSGILSQYPDIQIDSAKVGIYGEVVTLNTIVQANDRIEIYRPLKQDPKEARRARARRQDSHQKQKTSPN